MNVVLKLIFSFVAVLVATLAVYFATAFGLYLLPANSDYKPIADGIKIHVITSSVHTDIVIPAQDQSTDWQSYFPKSDFLAISEQPQWIGFGWGDRAFYQDVLTFDDLTLATAANAMLWPSDSVMHIRYYDDLAYLLDRHGIEINTFTISTSHYDDLVAFLKASVRLDENNKPTLIHGLHYEENDAFYIANGHYTALRTCNNWAGEGLRIAGIPMGYWTPMVENVRYFLSNYSLPSAFARPEPLPCSFTRVNCARQRLWANQIEAD